MNGMPEQPQPDQPTDATGWLESTQKFATDLFVGEEVEAGIIPDVIKYNWFKMTLPSNLRDESQYDLRYYWDNNGKPGSFDDVKGLGHFSKVDGVWHAGSVDPTTGRFLKKDTHPTVRKELAWYKSNAPDAVKFRESHSLTKEGEFWQYVAADAPVSYAAKKNSDDVISLMRKEGFNDRAIVALMSNVAVETGGTYSWKTRQQKGGPGIGLFQYDFMKPLYYKYLKRKGLTDSAKNQIKFAHETIYGEEQGVFGATRAKELRRLFEDPNATASQAYEYVFNKWENPRELHKDRRDAAFKYWSRKLLKGAGNG